MRVCSQCNKPGHNKRTCTQKADAQTAGYIEVIKEMGAEQRKQDPRRKSTLDPETREAIDWYLKSKYPWYDPNRVTPDEEE